MKRENIELLNWIELNSTQDDTMKIWGFVSGKEFTLASRAPYAPRWAGSKVKSPLKQATNKETHNKQTNKQTNKKCQNLTKKQKEIEKTEKRRVRHRKRDKDNERWLTGRQWRCRDLSWRRRRSWSCCSPASTQCSWCQSRCGDILIKTNHNINDDNTTKHKMMKKKWMSMHCFNSQQTHHWPRNRLARGSLSWQ